MRRCQQALLAAAAALYALGAGGVALAADPLTQIFFSPMGEPFRATAANPFPSKQWFAIADTNRDGVVSREEFRADAMRFFKVLDVDGDGKISDREMTYYEYKVAPEIVGASVDTSDQSLKKPDENEDHPHHTGLADIRQGAAFFSWLNDAEPVRSADIDFNRKVTPDEWKAAADRKFSALDPEGTGGIKLADMPETPLQVQLRKKR